MAANTQNSQADSTPRKPGMAGCTRRRRLAGGRAAHFLIEKLIGPAVRGIDIPYSANTQYINTIPADQQPKYPGDPDMEIKLHSTSAGTPWPWSCAPTNTPTWAATLPPSPPPQPSTTWAFRISGRASIHETGGDLIFFRATRCRASLPCLHAGPPDRRPDGQLPSETDGRASPLPAPVADAGLLAVPHRVHGPGPCARSIPPASRKYLASRGLIDAARPSSARCGPSWATARRMKPRIPSAPSAWPVAKLDNLIFVISCNLQRLDGPVRGNGKIIQELEAEFRGAGWNVIKLIWGSTGTPCSPATRRASSRSA